MVDQLPPDALAAMYPVFEEEQPSPSSAASSGKGIACIGTSTRLVEIQHRLCEQTGMSIITPPATTSSFLENISILATWCQQTFPQILLFDQIALAAGVAQKLKLPLLHAKEIEFDSELMRVRVRAPLYNGLVQEESVAKDLPQIVFFVG